MVPTSHHVVGQYQATGRDRVISHLHELIEFEGTCDGLVRLAHVGIY